MGDDQPSAKRQAAAVHPAAGSGGAETHPRHRITATESALLRHRAHLADGHGEAAAANLPPRQTHPLARRAREQALPITQAACHANCKLAKAKTARPPAATMMVAIANMPLPGEAGEGV